MDKKSLFRLVRRALAEDAGAGDCTTQLLVSPEVRAGITVVAKSRGVLSGATPFRAVFAAARADVEDRQGLEDGTTFSAGDELIRFQANAARALTAERTALNFLQRLSGVATRTAEYVRAVEGTGAMICDTRKTTPGLRALEKEAVLHGGGHNHRHGLYDGILIKENHIAMAGGIAGAVRRARGAAHHLMRIEVEARNLSEVESAIEAGADVILLDNMSVDDMRAAVALRSGREPLFEASGNIHLDNVRQVAETGVDLISVGEITHSAPAADLSLFVKPE